MKIVILLKLGYCPLSGPYSQIGYSLLHSLQLTEEINDNDVIIVPKTQVIKKKKSL